MCNPPNVVVNSVVRAWVTLCRKQLYIAGRENKRPPQLADL